MNLRQLRALSEVVKQVEEMVLGLETLADIRTLMQALAGPAYKTLGVRY